MDQAGITTFLAVLRAGSLSRASHHLHVAQSTISHRLKVLETSLGTTLFARGKGQAEVTLTPEGRRFLALAQRWEGLRAEAMAIAGAQGRSLALGASDSFNSFLLPPLYRWLSRQAPGLHLRVETADSAELYTRLLRRDLQVAFVQYEQHLPAMSVRRLFKEPLVLASCGALPAAEDGVVELASARLDPTREVFVDWGRGYQTWRQRWWGGSTGGVHVGLARMIIPFMEDPAHWTIVPLSMARVLAERERWRIWRLRPAPPDRIVYRAQPEPSASGGGEELTLVDRALRAVRGELRRLCAPG